MRLINARYKRRWSIALALLLAAASFVAVSPPALAWAPYCGPSKFVEKIELDRDSAGNFAIVVTPKAEARSHSALALNPRDAVVDEWHAIQDCVPDLYGPLADSIWQQLDCHQRLAWAWNPEKWNWATGDTYDLESWRPPLTIDGLVTEAATRCGNQLGVNPQTALINPFAPDRGATDLQHAYDSIA